MPLGRHLIRAICSLKAKCLLKGRQGIKGAGEDLIVRLHYDGLDGKDGSASNSVLGCTSHFESPRMLMALGISKQRSRRSQSLTYQTHHRAPKQCLFVRLHGFKKSHAVLVQRRAVRLSDLIRRHRRRAYCFRCRHHGRASRRMMSFGCFETHFHAWRDAFRMWTQVGALAGGDELPAPPGSRGRGAPQGIGAFQRLWDIIRGTCNQSTARSELLMRDAYGIICRFPTDYSSYTGPKKMETVYVWSGEVERSARSLPMVGSYLGTF